MNARHFLFSYYFNDLRQTQYNVQGYLNINAQDPIIVTKFYDKQIFTASNGWKIRTVFCPEIRLDKKTIFIKGTDANESKSGMFFLPLEEFACVSVALQEFCINFNPYPNKGHLLTKIFKDNE